MSRTCVEKSLFFCKLFFHYRKNFLFPVFYRRFCLIRFLRVPPFRRGLCAAPLHMRSPPAAHFSAPPRSARRAFPLPPPRNARRAFPLPPAAQRAAGISSPSAAQRAAGISSPPRRAARGGGNPHCPFAQGGRAVSRLFGSLVQRGVSSVSETEGLPRLPCTDNPPRRLRRLPLGGAKEERRLRYFAQSARAPLRRNLFASKTFSSRRTQIAAETAISRFAARAHRTALCA